jgi:hypothetical protein
MLKVAAAHRRLILYFHAEYHDGLSKAIVEWIAREHGVT